MSSIDDYEVGMTVYGRITGIKSYGAFVTFDDDVNGLIHISELSNGFVRDISNYVSVGEYYLLKVIEIDRDKKQLRLSFKALQENSRKHIKRVHFAGIPDNQIGFESIQKKMPEWLGEETK